MTGGEKRARRKVIAERMARIRRSEARKRAWDAKRIEQHDPIDADEVEQTGTDALLDGLPDAI
jgi:hypothetical protein